MKEKKNTGNTVTALSLFLSLSFFFFFFFFFFSFFFSHLLPFKIYPFPRVFLTTKLSKTTRWPWAPNWPTHWPCPNSSYPTIALPSMS